MKQKGKNIVDGMQPFQRLQAELAKLIASIPPGNRLLAEPELAKQIGVSRATLREAMRTFEGQGLIRRRQGIGTFVVAHPHVMESGLEVLESIETLAKRIQFDVSMGALDIRRVEADKEQGEALGVEIGTSLVKVARTINADNRPVAYLVDILTEDILTPADLDRGFTGSVLDLLLQRGNPSLSNSFTEINAVEAPSDIARALQIQRRDVLIKFTARLYDTNQRVVDFSASYFLPGYFRFHVVRRIGMAASHF